MLRLTGVIGDATAPALAEPLHALEQRGAVERITLRAEDVARRRLRVVTDRGTACALILGRGEPLRDGAVLLLEPERAVLVRVAPAAWLRVEARDAAAALELGYLAGNLHWAVRFEGAALWVRLDGAPAAHRARLARLLEADRIRVTQEAAPPATAAAGEPARHEHGPASHGHAHHGHDDAGHAPNGHLARDPERARAHAQPLARAGEERP